MPTFGSIAPGMDDENELLSRYYDPGTGLPVGGTDKYAPPKPRRSYLAPDVGAALPEAYGAGQPIQDPLVHFGQKGIEAAKSLVDTARSTPYGLRREDVTDIPADYTPDPTSPTRGYLPRTQWQPIDPLVGQAVQQASGMIGGPAVGAAEEGGAVLGSSMLRRKIKDTAIKKATQDTISGGPDVLPPGIGHNQPPPEEQLSPRDIAYPPPPAPVADRSQYIDVRTGLPIQSARYTKEARRILDEINAGPKGAGPIDLTKTSNVSVPQTQLPRYDPPQGTSARLQDAFNNPDVLDGLRQGIRKGIQMGAHRWYDSSEPIRAAFIDELGPVEGEKSFKEYIDNVAATSPRSDVPTNVRNASYYYGHATPADLPDKLPYPYGHMAQKLHRQNFETISSASGWEPLQNPKPSSFSENLRGNYEPVTVDTHAFRAIGMRTGDPRFLESSLSAKYKMGTDPEKDTIVNKYGERGKGDTVTFRPQQLYRDGKLSIEDAKKIPYFWAAVPRDNEYGAVEDLYRYLGDEHGITPAAAQGAGWAGSGELTGLGTVPDKTFGEMLNERILFTAKMRGEDPKQTLKDFIRKKKPLLSTAIGAGAAGAAAAGAGGQGGEERQ